jgi:tRNA threonylcarbamoyladenosine biosynthesis protein TsaE
LTRRHSLAVELPDTSATERLGRALAEALPGDAAGWTVLLNGELGAGKSTLVRAYLHAKGHTGPVPSPTYTLVEPYEFPELSVYHIDLYRVGDPEELRYLGFDELGTGLRLVEWPDRAPGLAEVADLEIRLDYRGGGRVARLEALSERGGRWLSDVSPALEAALNQRAAH